MHYNITFTLEIVSILAFFFYGLSCIFHEKLVLEFKRYRLEKFRVLTGVLETLGALGIIVGFYIPLIKLLASLGLAVLMLCGIIVRIRIKDKFYQILPALILGLINAYIFYNSLINF